MSASSPANSDIRRWVPKPPSGRKLLEWYGPGLLWMLSSVGSGSVLFTPRVGSRYGYGLLWIALLIIFIQWVVIREVGRYTVVSGKTLLDGYRELPGPKGWAVWVIFVPQIFAAIITIAGIAALAGSALMIAFPLSQAFYSTALILICIGLVLWGKYKGIERVSSFLSLILIAAAAVAAILVFPSPEKFFSGFRPQIPQQFDMYFVIPWLGFILAGAIGMMWFSYWVSEKGYGGSVMEEAGAEEQKKTMPEEEKIRRLKKWMSVMTTAAAIGVIGGGIVVISFLILGTEILKPQGIVPEGIAVAEDLTKLLSGVMGPIGYWIVLLGIFIALFGTVLADQDGWGRTFADATRLLFPKRFTEKEAKFRMTTESFLRDREKLKNTYAFLITAVFPLVLFYIVRKPVEILSVAGTISAIHTPFVIFITQYLNHRKLHKALRPGWFISGAMIFSGLFFTIVALVYFSKLLMGH